LEKIRRGISGLGVRRSIAMKVRIKVMATTKPPRVRAEAQPQSLALIKVKTRAIVPSVIEAIAAAARELAQAAAEA
jgi:hypothetical protein